MEEILFVSFNPENAFFPPNFALHSNSESGLGCVGFVVIVSSPGLVLFEEECPVHYSCCTYNKSVQRSSHCQEFQ
jgi:hypothetical protein